MGIDLGIKNLATLSNGQEMANLDLKHKNQMIKKYQKNYPDKNTWEKLSKNTKKIPWIAKQKKQQNTKCMTSTPQKTS